MGKMRGINLSEYEETIVKQESERRGLFSFSAMLRQIIREWATMKDEKVRITEEGRKALEENKKNGAR